jgi:NAD(P)-dependent dehydrogenase (short-subunit alcohol dehydrogenase family)
MAGEWGALRLSGRLLEGRSVVITGAGSPNGIGRATAKLFAAHGARVASLDIDEQGAQETAADTGEQHIGLRCDITEQASCASAIDQVMSNFGSEIGDTKLNPKIKPNTAVIGARRE